MPTGSDAGVVLVPVRRRAREVRIGDVTIGGAHPVAIQSMTNTRTADAVATAAQVARLARAGCPIVRLTVPAPEDADALPEIRRILRREGVRVALVADVHFSPRLALAAVEHVDKVRINPGNYAERKRRAGGYDGAAWDEDVARAREKLAPLVRRARELGVAIRIGVNHGSLSDRITWRYGDTPEGMVASALEFLEMCEDLGHRDLVVSLKSSNTLVMVRAYRLLAERLGEERAWPFHLGVTEAGGGDDGRIKSAIGIATLLADGIGETIRVSLTEDPVAEVPVARELVERFARPVPSAGEEPSRADVIELRDPPDPRRRPAAEVLVGDLPVGGAAPPRVEVVLPATAAPGRAAGLMGLEPPFEAIDLAADRPEEVETALATRGRAGAGGPARCLTLRGEARAVLARPGVRARLEASVDRIGIVLAPGEDPAEFLADVPRIPVLLLLEVHDPLPAAAAGIVAFARALAGRAPRLLAGLAPAPGVDPIPAYRLLAAALDRAGSRVPIVLSLPAPAGDEDPRLRDGGVLGSLLLDGIGDAVRLPGGDDPATVVDRVHRVLQGARRRFERAEFIACPSCGRTLFDLEETVARVRERTGHLKLRIAVMGCIVNGPGEMADADYGYVGWGPGKVALFAGRELVARDVPAEEAPDRLVELIRARGDWIDPPPGRQG